VGGGGDDFCGDIDDQRAWGVRGRDEWPTGAGWRREERRGEKRRGRRKLTVRVSGQYLDVVSARTD